MYWPDTEWQVLALSWLTSPWWWQTVPLVDLVHRYIPANFHDLGVYYTILTLCHDCTIVFLKNPLKHDLVKIYTKNIVVPDFELCPMEENRVQPIKLCVSHDQINQPIKNVFSQDCFNMLDIELVLYSSVCWSEL